MENKTNPKRRIEIPNESVLVDALGRDISSCDKNKIVFLAGHFPLTYDTENKSVHEGINKWGAFSPYSLKLGCQLGEQARELGKGVEFVFFVDDHTYYPREEAGSWAKRRRRHLYADRSGQDAKLNEIFREIMSKSGFSEENVVRHDHGKKGREDCLYFSEKILRASDRDIKNDCAREYTEFLEDKKYFAKENSHLVAFVPDRCSSNICNYVLDNHVDKVSASHVFMRTDFCLTDTSEMSVDDLFTKNLPINEGVTYRRD